MVPTTKNDLSADSEMMRVRDGNEQWLERDDLYKIMRAPQWKFEQSW